MLIQTNVANCRRSCKKCSDYRPCERCVNAGYPELCVDLPRKIQSKNPKEDNPLPPIHGGVKSGTSNKRKPTPLGQVNTIKQGTLDHSSNGTYCFFLLILTRYAFFREKGTC